MPFSSPNPPAYQADLRSHPAEPSDSALINHERLPFEQAFRMLPDVVNIYDIEKQQVVYSNRTFASLLGYEIKSIADDGLLHPDDVTALNDTFQCALRLNDNDNVDVRYRLKSMDGQWQWFSERQVIFKRHEDGSPAQILKTARCEKASKINSPSLSRADLLHHITEYNLPNFAFLLFDHNLCYTAATGILLRRIGYATAAVEGHHLRDVMQPEMADWLEPAYQAALVGTGTHMERTIAGIIVSIDCLPVRNECGEIMAGMMLAEDITDKKQAAAALVESEQRFAQFSENMQALFWMLDTDHRKALYLSPTFQDMWEISLKQAYEDPVVLLGNVHPDDQQLIIDTFKETFATGHHDIRFRILPPSGKLRWLSSRAFPIYDDTGKLYRVAGIADDITQQMEMEKITFDVALEREHMRLLSQFISTTSHELRTPLTIINTSLYLMKKMSDPVKQAERLQIIEHQVAQLARLVGQMHMLLRVESVMDNSTAQPVALNKILAKLETDYAPAIAKKELMFELIFADNLAGIHIDPDLLLVALQNIFENAINYTDTGSIKAQTTMHDNEVILTVEDTGIGIDAEDLPHIFERFYKVESNKRRTAVAAGLGLAITQRIMELSGGRVEVESELGVGSAFRLIWPVRQSA